MLNNLAGKVHKQLILRDNQDNQFCIKNHKVKDLLVIAPA